MSADRQSLKTIAKALNRECVPPPRPRAGKRYATWCPTCIRAMQRRELYAGKLIWNSSRFVKMPGTNKRVRRMRPQSEWRTMAHPEPQIVSDDLWQRVKERQEDLLATYGGAKHKGLQPRSATSPYLLSGILKCGVMRGVISSSLPDIARMATTQNMDARSTSIAGHARTLSWCGGIG
jgi:site-specific DNA recombinase